jgi:hypothetical protein
MLSVIRMKKLFPKMEEDCKRMRKKNLMKRLMKMK